MTCALSALMRGATSTILSSSIRMSPPWITPIAGSTETMVAFLMSCLAMIYSWNFIFRTGSARRVETRGYHPDLDTNDTARAFSSGLGHVIANHPLDCFQLRVDGHRLGALRDRRVGILQAVAGQ